MLKNYKIGIGLIVFIMSFVVMVSVEKYRTKKEDKNIPLFLIIILAISSMIVSAIITQMLSTFNMLDIFIPITTETTNTITTNDGYNEDSIQVDKIVADKLYRPNAESFCNQYTKYVSGYFENQGYVKMRFGPSKIYYNVIGQINNGNTVTVQTNSVNGWTLIYYEEKEGWVRTDFLFDTYEGCFGATDQNSIKVYPDTKTESIKAYADVYGKYDGEPLNMRIGPSKEYQLVVEVPDETDVIILGYSQSHSDWIYIEYEGHRGWVLSKYVS